MKRVVVIGAGISASVSVSVSAEPAPFRLLAGPATVGGRPVVLQVGRSEAFMRLEIRELALVFLLFRPQGLFGERIIERV